MSTASRNPDDPNPDSSPGPRRGDVPVSPSGATPGRDAVGDLHPDLARRKGVRRTRTGALWTALVSGILILLLLLVFVLQNLDSITLELFGWDFSLPLGVALLFAAIAGAAIVGIAGGLRILQLRHAANRQRTLSTGPATRS
ncbi:MAG: lipopolysaccharide assembly protein LapA domain-containing protein [Rhodococcus sp. (in: high G+C Gram-positive bacteria)]|uniref:lipopolysaccharide assembly protein LapA domain-containing protein n=1 Tax=Rhodococcus sp. TaxID=1831 RepID=UPI003BB4C71D